MSLPSLSGVSEPSKPTVVVPPTPTPVAVRPISGMVTATPQPGADPVSSQSAADADEDDGKPGTSLPIFYRYEIKTGDTLIGIALRFGIDAQYILWNNIDIVPDADLLRPGLTLQIPSVEGIIHDVRLHETLIEIAEQYDADIADIVSFAANNLPDANTVREGSTILVPGGRIVAPPPPPQPTPTPTPPPRPTPVVATPTPSAPTVSTYGFIWPAAGKITSWFGPSHPLGIDIGMPTGSPVWAAAAGQVTFVGGHPCCSYGYYVIIRHDQTFTTRYGHFSRFAVKLGQHVEQGRPDRLQRLHGRPRRARTCTSRSAATGPRRTRSTSCRRRDRDACYRRVGSSSTTRCCSPSPRRWMLSRGCGSSTVSPVASRNAPRGTLPPVEALVPDRDHDRRLQVTHGARGDGGLGVLLAADREDEDVDVAEQLGLRGRLVAAAPEVRHVHALRLQQERGVASCGRVGRLRLVGVEGERAGDAEDLHAADLVLAGPVDHDRLAAHAVAVVVVGVVAADGDDVGCGPAHVEAGRAVGGVHHDGRLARADADAGVPEPANVHAVPSLGGAGRTRYPSIVARGGASGPPPSSGVGVEAASPSGSLSRCGRGLG